MSELPQPLLDFLSRSPTPFHVVANLGTRLAQAGFRRLAEGDDWGGLDKGRYFVTRNDSSLIAFNWSGDAGPGFRMVGAHTDSPCLKVKPEAISESEGYARLALEVYGGALLAPWFDRDLGLAGRVTYRDREGRIGNALVDFDRPVAFIPSLAIHLDRKVNENRSINMQDDLPALLCTMRGNEPGFPALLEKQLDAQGIGDVSGVLGFELSLYDRQPAAVVGLEEEFIASARLDNLLSCFAATEALIGNSAQTNAVIVLSDHEEVGSNSASGADGTFLRDVLGRICGDAGTLARAVSHSMLVSVDNAHGVHPNYPDKHEPAHRPMINAGPVIKINHNQRYATNSETEALFRHVCEQGGVPVQSIVVRSDMGCGTTIGPITAARLGVRTVDVGIPQLGMHSIRELAGVQDQDFLVRALAGFFGCSPWPF
ncbi:MAG: M18 family aminopeptidase [Gammaproteobacteria bacterium]|nr:M18 family aminopeptidase [Gammaproteobacteria bacterium]